MLKTPPLQTATATIETLCGRLQSATLLEDRRAAILGLRSFAKQYPASVASGSLRELIATLRRDGVGNADGSAKKSRDASTADGEEGGDVDTIRLVMETLVNLFNPDSASAETSDEILFFMADEFSMRQDNVSLLLSILDPTSPVADYYSRLYSLQLLSAICAARPERLQECILSAPLGVSRLVGVLDDARDAVRNAGLLLLVDLTAGASDELRKIVAFEDAFGKIFALIRLEGGLGDAGITAQDCLSLLANLIRNSASNQSMFRESGCVAQLKQLLGQIFPSEDDAPFVTQSREKGGWGVLALIGLFLVPGENFSAQNQTAFFRAGTAQTLIDLGFAENIAPPVRAAALKDAALLIQANAPLQESFASMTVYVSIEESMDALPNGDRSKGSSTSGGQKSSAKSSARPSAEKQPTYIIEALLELALSNTRQDQPSRSAGCALIQAYLTKHDRIRAHFLQRAIAGHAENEKAANALNTLLQPTTTDPLGVTFASWIVQDLIVDNLETKAMLSAVKEGDEDAGEDVLTAIQSFGSHLQTALQQGADERVVLAHASLLIVVLWQFPEGIDNLLAEGSSLLQTLAEQAKAPTTSPAVSGISSALLGVLYEFSTKDSPIARRTLASILIQKLGRSTYLTALLSLRQHPGVRDFGLDDQDPSSPTPEIQLSETFVDLFLYEYPRLRKAIDKDPGIEVLATSAAEEGVDRDVLDTLRKESETLRETLSTAQQDALVLNQAHETEKLTASKELQTATAEIERLRRSNSAMQSSHENESSKLQTKYKQDLEQLQRTSEQRAHNAANEAQRSLAAAKRETETAITNAKAEVQRDWSGKVQELEKKVAEGGNALRSEQARLAEAARALETLKSEHDTITTQSKDLGSQVESLTSQLDALKKSHEDLKAQAGADAQKVGDLTSQLENHEKDLAASREKVEETVAELKAREAELASEREGFNELESEFEAFRRKAESEREKEVEERRKKREEREMEKVAEKEEREKREKEVESERQGKEKLEKEIAGEREEREKLGKDLASEKEGKQKLEKDIASEREEREKEKAKEQEEPSKANAQKDKKGDKKDKDAQAVQLFKSKVEALGKEVRDLKAEVKTAGEKTAVAEKALETARKDAETAKKDADTAKKDAETAKKDLAAAKKDVEQARKDAETAKQDLETAKKLSTTAEADLQTAKEGEKSAKEELESMLLVMGDLEAKRDEYRGKVKKLGGDVSEDEDEDDDDESDEEGDRTLD
ncbi:hypothetical protein MBLNU230_g7709t1 [Neophaeotheca triangularis]